MRNYLILPLLALVVFTLPSCSLYRKLNEISQATTVQTQKVDAALASVEASAAALGEKGKEFAEKIAGAREDLQAADANKDGVFSGSEWLQVLLVFLGLLGFGKYAKDAKTVNAQITTTDEKRRENAKTFYAEIDGLKQKTAALEATLAAT